MNMGSMDMSNMASATSMMDMSNMASATSMMDMSSMASATSMMDMGSMASGSTMMDMSSMASATSMMDMSSMASATSMMDMGSMASGSTMMDMSSMASATSMMDMGSMASATSMMDMGSMASGSTMMHMGNMDMMSMNMWFSSVYKNYPVLFKGLSASGPGQAFGIFLLFFFASFLTKGFEFLKNYLESKVWNNPNYQIPESTTVVEDCACDDDKVSDVAEGTTPTGTHRESFFTVLGRDAIRITLCFLSELFGYAMMLVVMTYSLVYFFAVVLGMTFGRFFFERLSDKINVRPGGNNFQGHH